MNPQRRRVAVTGLGLVTPAGNGVDATWRTLLAGRGCAGPIRQFDASGFSTRIAAEVQNFDPAAAFDDGGDRGAGNGLGRGARIGSGNRSDDGARSGSGFGKSGRKLLKFANRSHGFALAAAEQALTDAGIRPSAATRRRWACAVGTGMMGLEFADLLRLHAHSAADGELDTRRLLDDEVARDPMVFCRTQAPAGAALLSQRFGIGGYLTSVHTACASGGQAVGTGLKLIRRGAADCVLAGGFDAMITPMGLAGFCLLSAVSPDNDAPERASRPFDATRNGFVLGEGAGFLVLEEWESARRRGARIYAELAGDGNSLSSYRITDSHPSGDGPIQSMRQALADAGLSYRDVDYVNAHGTSTPMNDRSEAAAIRAVFAERAGDVAVSSTKSVMGHLIAAAGAVEAAVCALAIHRSELPVNANLREPDPECELDLVLDTPRRRRVRAALSNSLGFGGSNSSLVFRHPEEVDGERG